MKYVNTQPKPFFLLLTLDTSLEIQFQENRSRYQKHDLVSEGVLNKLF